MQSSCYKYTITYETFLWTNSKTISNSKISSVIGGEKSWSSFVSLPSATGFCISHKSCDCMIDRHDIAFYSVGMGQCLISSKLMTLQGVAIAGFFQPDPTVLILCCLSFSQLFVWSFSDLLASIRPSAISFEKFASILYLLFGTPNCFSNHAFIFATWTICHKSFMFGRVALTSIWWVEKVCLPNLIPPTFIIM